MSFVEHLCRILPAGFLEAYELKRQTLRLQTGKGGV